MIEDTGRNRPTDEQWEMPRHSDLRWPTDIYYILFHPFQFFRTEIHRQSFRGAAFSAAANTLFLSLLVATLEYLYGPFVHGNVAAIDLGLSDGEFAVLSPLLVGAAVWAWLMGLSIVLAPGMSGCSTFAEARRRAFRVAAATTALVWPALAAPLLMHLLPTWIFFVILIYWIGLPSVAIPVFGGWSLFLMLLGLIQDEPPSCHQGPAPRRAACPLCGRVSMATVGDRCPGCGQAIPLAAPPSGRRLSPVETSPSLRTGLRTWCQASFRPRQFWSTSVVLADCHILRNVWVLSLVAVAGIVTVPLTMAASWCVPSEAVSVWGLLTTVASVCAAVLTLNHLVLLAGSAAARLAGSRLPFHALARLGYLGLGPAAAIEVVAGYVALRGLSGESVWLLGQVGLTGAAISGAVVVLAAAWSLGLMVQAVHLTRGAASPGQGEG